MKLLLRSALCLLLAAGAADRASAQGNGRGEKLKKAGPNGKKIQNSYIVVFDATTRDEDVGRKARDYTEASGGRVKGKPLKLVRGFAAEMTEGQAIAMSQRSDVEVRRHAGLREE